MHSRNKYCGDALSKITRSPNTPPDKQVHAGINPAPGVNDVGVLLYRQNALINLSHNIAKYINDKTV